jgi:DNA polymerase-4
VERLDVAKFHGVGPATAAKMNRLGIHTGFDLRRQTLAFLTEHFGKAGRYYYGVARGEDEREVETDRIRKSVGAETTFERDLHQWHEVGPALEPIFAKLWSACVRGGHAGRTVTVKVKYADFHRITRSCSGHEPVKSQDELTAISLDLLKPLFPSKQGVRLLGATLSGLEESSATRAHQLALALP